MHGLLNVYIAKLAKLSYTCMLFYLHDVCRNSMQEHRVASSPARVVSYWDEAIESHFGISVVVQHMS